MARPLLRPARRRARVRALAARPRRCASRLEREQRKEALNWRMSGEESLSCCQSRHHARGARRGRALRVCTCVLCVTRMRFIRWKYASRRCTPCRGSNARKAVQRRAARRSGGRHSAQATAAEPRRVSTRALAWRWLPAKHSQHASARKPALQQRRPGRAPGQLAAVSDDDRRGGLAGLAAVALDVLHHIHALHNLAEHHVLAVQPRCARRARGASVSARRRRKSRTHGAKVTRAHPSARCTGRTASRWCPGPRWPWTGCPRPCASA